MRLALVFHQPDPASNEWSTPRGLGDALAEQGVIVEAYPFSSPEEITLPSLCQLQQSGVSVLFVCYAGPAPQLDLQLLALRQQIDKQQLDLKIISELGDEPQTRWCNAVRVQVSDLCLSPDAESVRHWVALGANCIWFTHWADTSIFRQHNCTPRSRFVVTTMGARRYARRLSLILGSNFSNRYCMGLANSEFYSSGMIAFQYARWGEITRRIFEAAACGCCVLTNRLPPQSRIEELFPSGQAIVYYDGFWSMLDALWRLYRDPQWRHSVALEGQRRVLESHTQNARASQFIAAINLLSNNQRAR